LGQISREIEKSAVIFGDYRIFHNNVVEENLVAKSQLDPSSRFRTTPACDGPTQADPGRQLYRAKKKQKASLGFELMVTDSLRPFPSFLFLFISILFANYDTRILS